MPFFRPKATKATDATPDTSPHFLTPDKIMIARIPIFGGGKNESFNTFARHVEMQISNDANDTTKMETMLLRLYGKAADTFIEKASQNPTISFEEIIAELRKHFPEPLINSLQVLRRRKQLPHESLENFAESIRELVNKFYTNQRGYNKQTRDFHMVKHFIYNVQPSIKQKLKKFMRNFKDLNQVYLEAAKIDQMDKSRQIPQLATQMSHMHLQEQQHMLQQNNHFFQQRHNERNASRSRQRPQKYWQRRQ